MKSILHGADAVVPSKILCVGRNYAAHAAELGNAVPDEMVVFGKPNSAIGTELRSAFDGEALHFETEICLLMRGGQVAAVGVGLDLTRRATQSRLKAAGLPWERCKAFRGSALFGAFVDAPADLGQLRLELDIDGHSRQRGGVADMLFAPAQILAELAAFTELEDGDIVMTGTPEGVGEVVAGARFEARVFDGERLLCEATWVAR